MRTQTDAMSLLLDGQCDLLREVRDVIAQVNGGRSQMNGFVDLTHLLSNTQHPDYDLSVDYAREHTKNWAVPACSSSLHYDPVEYAQCIDGDWVYGCYKPPSPLVQHLTIQCPERDRLFYAERGLPEMSHLVTQVRDLALRGTINKSRLQLIDELMKDATGLSRLSLSQTNMRFGSTQSVDSSLLFELLCTTMWARLESVRIVAEDYDERVATFIQAAERATSHPVTIFLQVPTGMKWRFQGLKSQRADGAEPHIRVSRISI